jgi:hypothetical protein
MPGARIPDRSRRAEVFMHAVKSMIATLVALMLFTAACAKVQNHDPLDQPGSGGVGVVTGAGGARTSRDFDAGTGVIVDTGTGESCGSFNFKPTAKTAVLMLVLDRSGSMKNSLPNNAGTKWTVTTAAVDPAISGTQKSIQWGMKTFPGDNGCAVATGIDVPIAPMNYPMMSAKIMATMPEGDGTPTGDGVLAAATYLKGLTTTDPKYILLATDGDPTCPGDGITYALAQVTAARNAGIPTFVIGVGTGNDSGANLDSLAVAGGQARPVTNPLDTKYFPADSPTELADTLKTITGQIASCVFSLGQRPPDPQFVNVTLGATEIPFDVAGVNGWQFAAGDTSTVNVVGNWCDEIQSSPDAVGVVFGCRPPIIP